MAYAIGGGAETLSNVISEIYRQATIPDRIKSGDKFKIHKDLDGEMMLSLFVSGIPPPSKSASPGEMPRFLDITALKQQPKFL